jgi:hypothetical protein
VTITILILVWLAYLEVSHEHALRAEEAKR